LCCITGCSRASMVRCLCFFDRESETQREREKRADTCTRTLVVSFLPLSVLVRPPLDVSSPTLACSSCPICFTPTSHPPHLSLVLWGVGGGAGGESEDASRLTVFLFGLFYVIDTGSTRDIWRYIQYGATFSTRSTVVVSNHSLEFLILLDSFLLAFISVFLHRAHF